MRFFGRLMLVDSVLRNRSRPSVRPSLSFLKIGSSVFSNIVHDDSWPWYKWLTKPDFWKKKFGPKFGWKGPRSGPKLGFSYFLKFGSLVFLEITYNDRLQQCLTSRRGKTHEKKKFWNQIWAKNEPKSGPQLFFLPFFQVWFISFPLNYIGCSLEYCLTIT